MYQRFLLFILFFSIYFAASTAQVSPHSRATGTISDSIDITHITLHLTITDYAGKTIAGNSEIHITSKVDNISSIPFDLKTLIVDSVKEETIVSFTQTDETLIVTIPTPLNTGDSTVLTVYYHGVPQQDATWGGWYWSGDYSYQLGVAFTDLPHNYGRIWFPCFDNFIERQTFTSYITTPENYKAFCGGLLQNEIHNADGTITWVWNLNQSIPSYLASVAVSTYATVNMLYHGIERDIAIEIGVKAADSTNLKNSFIHLQNALATFENRYGPYRWDRIGYVIVPFSGGAMEHATNIAYPAFAASGSLTYETIMAHELSHHWWGDLVTCSSAEDMWINEGSAVYSERLFIEDLYGENAYAEDVRNNHYDNLHYGAARDGNNYFPLSGMPQNYTYGNTTYNKGADVISTLRSYLGDDMFFNCLKEFLNTYQYKAVSAFDYENFLSDCSGKDMSDFFAGWIFNPGFPQFSIQSYQRNAENKITGICIEQKLDHAPAYFNNVPLDITFINSDMQTVYETHITMSGNSEAFEIPAVDAAFAIIDKHEKISDAISSVDTILKSTGLYNFSDALFEITVNAISDSAYLHIEHNYVAPDGFKTVKHGLHISTDRYWLAEGIVPNTFAAEGKILFNGQESFSGGYLDNDFISNTEDSLVLLYRATENDDWEIYPSYTLNTWGPKTDKRGAFELSQFALGEYTFGIYDATIPDDAAYAAPDCLGLQIEEGNIDSDIEFYPNPTSNELTIDFKNTTSVKNIYIINTSGSVLKKIAVDGNSKITFSTAELTSGLYLLKLNNPENTFSLTEKLLIIR